jgi:hypothetical protein
VDKRGSHVGNVTYRLYIMDPEDGRSVCQGYGHGCCSAKEPFVHLTAEHLADK